MGDTTTLASKVRALRADANHFSGNGNDPQTTSTIVNLYTHETPRLLAFKAIEEQLSSLHLLLSEATTGKLLLLLLLIRNVSIRK